MDMTCDMPHRNHCLHTCAVQVAMCRLPSALISASHTLFPGSWLVQIRELLPPRPLHCSLSLCSGVGSVTLLNGPCQTTRGVRTQDACPSCHLLLTTRVTTSWGQGCRYCASFLFCFLFRVWFEFAVSTELVHSRPLNPHEKPFLCFIYF